jgi:uncharacterized phage protein (TIGR02218 family)
VKTISPALQSHLQQDVTTLCTCWLITRQDGQVFAFTDHDKDLVISGQTYLASTGYTRTAIKSEATMAVDNVSVIGIMNSETISEIDLKGGKFDYAAVNVFMVNWADPTMGILKLRAGWFGETVVLPTGIFNTELRGLTQALTTEFVDQFSQLCRADLGDSKCTVDISSYRSTGVVTNNSVYGYGENAFTCAPLDYTATADVTQATVVFTKNATVGASITLQTGSKVQSYGIPFNYNSTDCVKFLTAAINASNAAGQIDATALEDFSADNVHAVTINVTNPSEGANVSQAGDADSGITIQNFGGNSAGTLNGDGYLAGGLVTWTSGLNTGLSMEIQLYDSSGAIVLFLSMPFTIANGDTFTYQPGCDKRRETCALRYNNMANFRGEPDLPGLDKAMAASSGGAPQ